MKRYYRHPKTAQELRANQENWHRGKRGKRYIPNYYWDIPIHYDNCWKTKRKQQYYHEKDFTKYSIILEYKYFNEWYLIEYFKENNISHIIKKLYIKKIGLNYDNQPYFYSSRVGTKVTWWYNKDIGLKYLLKQVRNTRNKWY
jgi:hypothetical protein